MEEIIKSPKFSVELKQTSRGFWYTGALKVNAEELEEFDELVKDAANRVKQRLSQLNSEFTLVRSSASGGGSPGISEVLGGTAISGTTGIPESLEGPKKSKKEKPDIILNEQEEKIFQNLKELRSLLAQKETVPPYIIFHDSHLKKIAKEKPLLQEELIKIIGDRKYEKYGALIEEILTRHRIEL